MKLNSDGIKLMHEFEGLKLQAYLCPAGVPTIGYGNTFYENGVKVKIGEVITKERADELFTNIVEQKFCEPLRKLLKVELNTNQFSALVCTAYNIGIGAISKSSLLKMVNETPNNPAIKERFLMWNKAGGKVLTGLTRRRGAEVNLYFKK